MCKTNNQFKLLKGSLISPAGTTGAIKVIPILVLLPNPSVNITCLQVGSQTYHCLYPGATFTGSQRCGCNSYSITDIDLLSSFLCGYLCIHGVTEDWPELTTYFDGEIMGNWHGFLTQKWEASEQVDMLHWQRFPAFHYLVISYTVVVNLSITGFYYICMEFNLWSPASTALCPTMVPEGSEAATSTLLPPRHCHCDLSVQRAGNGSSIGPCCPLLAAMVSGFYYHLKSELYQQLSLTHVVQTFSSMFEFC
ncbi:hypothetical protein PISMIDRAFT_629406 [Pisolithus microcarpus 441]|uniref:Uncharacterized protein n=1 Tax=Pisolithus microcarpus 441 TaxID=765257 RepID=A0A0C9ZA88_9AGAM|nr:hypothetical protein PISMIDRAFT_629406 [Pisolithus microcarpus 441]